MLNQDVECLGGIDYEHANDFHCFLIPPGVDVEGVDWSDIVYNQDWGSIPDGVIMLDTTDYTDCPDDFNFIHCFSVTFDGTNFSEEGEYQFAAVFTHDGKPVDINEDQEIKNDFKVWTFMVVPEAIIGALAMIGAMFSIFIAYNHLKRNN